MNALTVPLSSPLSAAAPTGPLASQSAVTDARQREELAAQFEGMFVSMLLKEMRATVEGGLFGGEQSDTYGALFDMHLGQHLADSGALGIRELLLDQSLRQTENAMPQGDNGEPR
jgi:flagellar protein FlgJ